jgi:hypothetical protein
MPSSASLARVWMMVAVVDSSLVMVLELARAVRFRHWSRRCGAKAPVGFCGYLIARTFVRMPGVTWWTATSVFPAAAANLHAQMSPSMSGHKATSQFQQSRARWRASSSKGFFSPPINCSLRAPKVSGSSRRSGPSAIHCHASATMMRFIAMHWQELTVDDIALWVESKVYVCSVEPRRQKARLE